MRRPANLISHKLVLEKAVHICHGGLLEAAGGMRDLVQRADHVLVLDGCGMACGTRIARGAFPDLSPEVAFTDKLFEYDQNLFGVDETDDSEINANANGVAQQVIEKYF